jgi:hypothetical protein
VLRKLRSLSQFLLCLHQPSRQFTCTTQKPPDVGYCVAQPLPIIGGPAGHVGLRLCHSFCEKKAKTCAKALLQAIGANGSSNPCLHHPSSTRKVPHAQPTAKKNCSCSPNASRRRFNPSFNESAVVV